MSKQPILVKDQELAELRHNLRTPVNHILGYGEMLIEDAEDTGNLDLIQDLRRVHDDGKQLLEVINRRLTPQSNEVREAELRDMHREILAPLNQIIVRSETLQQQAADQGGDDARTGDINKIHSAAQRLMAMVESIFVNGASSAPAPAPQTEDPVTPLAPAVIVGSHPVRQTGHLLVVDDNEANRDMLGKRLMREGYQISTAHNGRKALEMIRESGFDLVLLDIMMPEVDGFQVLTQMKADPVLADIPVIMISALDEIQSVVRCIETGAEDFLSKPFDPVLLRARIGACLEKKYLRDEQKKKTTELEHAIKEAESQRRVAESLLRNILPVPVAEELTAKGSVSPRYFEDVTILFTDFVGFTNATENLAAEDLVNILHAYFTAFDEIVTRYGIEKLKTIGDSYMLAGGLPTRSPSHPVDVVLAAFEIIRAVQDLATPEAPWQIRVGVHTGPVIAGMVGIKKFAFDVWGDSVNFSSRMESGGAPGRINISGRTWSRIKDFFACEARGRVLTKDNKEHEMFFVNGILPKLLDGSGSCPPPAFLRRYRIYFQKDPPAFPEFLATRTSAQS